jgi:hypothetical protein
MQLIYSLKFCKYNNFRKFIVLWYIKKEGVIFLQYFRETSIENDTTNHIHLSILVRHLKKEKKKRHKDFPKI